MLVSLKVSFSKNNYHPIIRLQNTITFFTSKNLCFKEYCDHIQGFQWLQLVIIEGYGTPLGCHMHWNSQNGLEVLLEPQRACTILPGTHCIIYLVQYSGSLTHCNIFCQLTTATLGKTVFPIVWNPTFV